jgi:hypothetical protein
MGARAELGIAHGARLSISRGDAIAEPGSERAKLARPVDLCKRWE